MFEKGHSTGVRFAGAVLLVTVAAIYWPYVEHESGRAFLTTVFAFILWVFSSFGVQ